MFSLTFACSPITLACSEAIAEYSIAFSCIDSNAGANWVLAVAATPYVILIKEYNTHDKISAE